MVTTIQLNENVKKILDDLKAGKETYEEVIVNLINRMETDKKEVEKLLKEEALEFAEENLKIAGEWEATLMDGLDKNEKWSR